jgi:hypothetical protein
LIKKLEKNQVAANACPHLIFLENSNDVTFILLRKFLESKIKNDKPAIGGRQTPSMNFQRKINSRLPSSARRQTNAQSVINVNV